MGIFVASGAQKDRLVAFVTKSDALVDPPAVCSPTRLRPKKDRDKSPKALVPAYLRYATVSRSKRESLHQDHTLGQRVRCRLKTVDVHTALNAHGVEGHSVISGVHFAVYQDCYLASKNIKY
jgi:hypothetical protein